MPLDILPATVVLGAAHALLVEQRMPSNPLQVMTNLICIASQFTPSAAEGEWQAATRLWTSTLRCAQVLPILLTSCAAPPRMRSMLQLNCCAALMLLPCGCCWRTQAEIAGEAAEAGATVRRARAQVTTCRPRIAEAEATGEAKRSRPPADC